MESISQMVKNYKELNMSEKVRSTCINKIKSGDLWVTEYRIRKFKE